jgi:hypothetical protein
MALRELDKLRLHIDSAFSFSEAAAAHPRLEAGSMTGP